MSPKASAVIALLLTGCSTAPREPESRAAEAVWQTANAYDWSQTINTARRPDCYVEKDPVTKAMFGPHPSESEVGLGWAIQATLHFLVSGWLDRKVQDTDADGWKATRAIWQIITLANTAKNIADNRAIGLRPFGKEDPCL